MASNDAFSVLGRMLRGKPAFVPKPGDTRPVSVDGSNTQQPASPYFGSDGRKRLPHVYIEEVDFNSNEDRAELWGVVMNNSEFEVELDKALLFGRSVELDYRMPPGQSRQFRLYQGAAFRAQPTGYVELQFKLTGNGDYFSNQHVIISRKDSEGVYEILRLDSSSVPRDI